jgi:hypothetical protein
MISATAAADAGIPQEKAAKTTNDPTQVNKTDFVINFRFASASLAEKVSASVCS